MAEAWTVRRERGSRFALALLVWIARRLGRPVARLVLRGAVAYYLLLAPDARRASRSYLRRVLGRPPGWRDLYRHLYTFGAVELDRVYLFTEGAQRLDVRVHGLEVLRQCSRNDGGAIIAVAHFGSFDMLRALGDDSDDAHLRVLMDRARGAKVNALLEALSPRAGAHIIDTSQSDVDRVLKVKAALARGEMIGLMVDRHRDGERTVDCRFLGGVAPFPISPWLLAGMVKAPVLLAFSIYRGGNRYDLYCEEFGRRLVLPRGQRQEQAAVYAQAYADRLADYVRQAPYNWFNFYDFWHHDACGCVAARESSPATDGE